MIHRTIGLIHAYGAGEVFLGSGFVLFARRFVGLNHKALGAVGVEVEIGLPLCFGVAFRNGLVVRVEGAGGANADIEEGIAEAFEEANGFMGQTAEGADGAFAHEGAFVFEELAEARCYALFWQVIGEESGIGSDPCRNVLAVQQFKEGFEGAGFEAVRGMNRPGPGALAVIRQFFAIPLFGPFDRPVHAFLFVTAIATVGDSQLLSEEGVRMQEAVIGTRVDLHIGALRHVAFHAAVAGAVGRVEAVLGRHNDGGVVEAGLVASHAEKVIFRGKDEGVAVRVVAVEASHPGVPHTAHAEGAVHKDFIADLTVRKIKTGLIGKGEPEVILVTIPDFKSIRSQLVTAGVASRAVVHDLLRIKRCGRNDGSILHAAARALQVRLQSIVAFRAGDSLLCPGAGVGIRLKVEIFLILGGVAIGTIGIPVHALSGPVTPFTGEAIFSLEDIDPAVLKDIVGRTDRLEATAGQGGEVLAQGGVANHPRQFIDPLEVLGGIEHAEFEALVLVGQFVGNARFNEPSRWGKGGFVQRRRDRAVRLGVVTHLPVCKNLGMAFRAGLRALSQNARRVVRKGKALAYGGALRRLALRGRIHRLAASAQQKNHF